MFKATMDPFSITIGCVAVIDAIAKTASTIRSFVRHVREAHQELGATARHLSDLEITINLIKDDHEPNSEILDTGAHVPQSIRTQTAMVMESCRGIITELDNLMDKYDPGRHQTALRWALGGRDDAKALNKQLEAHTRTLAFDACTNAVLGQL